MSTSPQFPAVQIDDEASTREAFERLDTLRMRGGSPAEFWPALLQIATTLTDASEASLLTRSRLPDDPGQWKEVTSWPVSSPFFTALRGEKGELERLLLKAEGDGAGTIPNMRVIAVRLVTGDTQRSSVIIARLGAVPTLAEAVMRLRLLADIPWQYQLSRALDQSRSETGRFAVVLDLMVLINAESRFLGAAMTLCNEVASRYRCERVSLGWLRRGYARLQALSHTEKFDRKMAVATALEAAMDEVLDQDEEILWPAPPETDSPESSPPVSRDHEILARSQGITRVLSLPIRVEGAVLGVLTMERAAESLQEEFKGQEMQTLRLLCDHVARRLFELKKYDRWLGARFASWLRDEAAKLVGPEHTVAKLAVVGVAILSGVLLFGKAEYRVEAPFILKSDALAQVPAPFDGYLDEVHFRVGERVEAGRPLLELDTRDLRLQEAAALAERQRFLAEARKAESENSVAEMRIAQASATEVQARLELIQYQIGQAKVLAPFDGYVIEGDLKERLSSPVKRGEVLAKVAKLDAIRLEVAMPERDVHEIRAAQNGEIAFSSRPQIAFPIRIERVEPAAEVREKGNIFLVRAGFAGPHESWWRPGMSGVAKVSVGRRGLWWICTHRTLDFLRLYFWW